MLHDTDRHLLTHLMSTHRISIPICLSTMHSASVLSVDIICTFTEADVLPTKCNQAFEHMAAGAAALIVVVLQFSCSGLDSTLYDPLPFYFPSVQLALAPFLPQIYHAF